MPVVLQITFRMEGESATPEEAAAAHDAAQVRAQKIANVPGLIWKIWIAQPNKNIYGGTYLFQDEASAQAYLNSPIPDDIRGMPDFTTQIFEVEEGFSAITHAPLTRPANNHG